MKRTISRLFAAMAVAAMAFGSFTACGPEEQPGGNGGGSGNGGGGNGGQEGPKTVAVTGVSLNKTSLSLVEGDTETLTATVAPSDATNKAISWKSSDANVANVDSNLLGDRQCKGGGGDRYFLGPDKRHHRRGR